MSTFSDAIEAYGACGVDAESALIAALETPISIQCWQGDDVRGFEGGGDLAGSGLAATGHYPGAARTPEELRTDLETVFTAVPGTKRLNLHACYGEFDQLPADRDALEPGHFQGWMQWAAAQGVALDFNPTFFAHRLATEQGTLSHPDPSVRAFWVEHGRRARRVAQAFAETLGQPSFCNVWIPDGMKETPADRRSPRERLKISLDEVFADPLPAARVIDAVESKLFGIGAESYTVGSHEFYLGYATQRQIWLCLDCGHFHPTESLADKLSAVLLHVPGVLLHVSRGVRWDSDHVVVQDDATRQLMDEIVAGSWVDRVAVGMDFFDASIHRGIAWAIGARATRQSLLRAFLFPWALLRKAEQEGDWTRRLALRETFESLPWGAVWAEACARCGSTASPDWIDHLRSRCRCS